MGHAFVVVWKDGLSVDNMQAVSNTILDGPSMAIFSVMIGFYFGSRGLEKFIKK